MEKEKINESVLGTILGGAILLLAYWAVKKVGSASVNLITRTMGSGTQIPSKNIKSFLDKLLKNRAFIVDFSKVIQDEGGIDEFIKKTKYSSDIWSSGDTVTPAVVWYGYKEFEKDENVGLDLNKNAVRIVDKLIKSNSFKSLAKKDKLTDKEISTVGNALFLTVTDDEFKKVGERYMKMALQKNANKLENSMSLKKLIPNNIK